MIKEDKMDCIESKDINSHQPDYSDSACAAAAAYFENLILVGTVWLLIWTLDKGIPS